MKSYTQKWAIVALLENVHVGMEFAPADWPLHVTLADVFATNYSGKQLAEVLEHFVQNNHELSVQVEGETSFGPAENRVPVLLLQKTDKLQDLHDSLLDALEDAAVVFNDPQYMRDGFVPHVSRGVAAGLKVGDVCTVNNIALVDMFPSSNADRRKITVRHRLTAVQGHYHYLLMNYT
jgi:2'-5' RNA ligase